MDRHRLEETVERGQEVIVTSDSVTVTSNTTSVTTVTTNNATASVVIAMMTTASRTTPPYSQAPPTSPGTATTERPAVQVIRQSVHSRPQTMAAQYLQQMYAAQQQHIRLQSAALQQQQQPHHHGNRQSPTSPSASNGVATQTTGTSITLPVSTGTGQLIGRSQCSSSTTGTITQQAMLLGNGSASCNQSQMYLRTQMLILTPAANLAAVPSELPSVCCSSTQHSASQVQSLAVRTHLPGALTTAQSVLLKPSFTQTLVSQPKMSICPLRPGQQVQPSTETSGPEARPADDTHITSANQIIAPASYTPVQSHAVVRHQLSCTPSHQGAPHQHKLIIQQTTTGSHRQLHPISLRLATHNTSPSAFPLTFHALATPTQTTTTMVQSQPGNAPPGGPSSSCELPAPPLSPQQTGVVSSSSAPPPLLCSSLLQPHRQPQLQPPTLRLGPISQASLPMLLQPPPASLQRLSLRSVQALAVQSTGVLVAEEELPVSEALVQMPFQNLQPTRTFQDIPQTFRDLSPPQTVAVDLKMQPASIAFQALKQRTERCSEEKTPPPDELSSPAGSKTQCEDIQPICTEICNDRLGFPCGPPSNCSIIHSSSEGPCSHASCSPPPLLPAAAVRSPGQSTSASATPARSPHRARPPILTHLIEGFVVREALQPFVPVPIGHSSLRAEQPATLPAAWEVKARGDPMPEMTTKVDRVPEIRANGDRVPGTRSNDDLAQENRTNGDRVPMLRTTGDPGPEENLMDTEQPDDTSDSDLDETPTHEEPASENLLDVLQCEFCGKRGYAHTFLRSKRFCSMTCVRRFNVSRTKRLSVLKVDKASRWGHRPMGRRGRPPGRVNRRTREHFLLRQGPYRSEETQKRLRGDGGEEDKDEPPVPMITRLRRQEERERRERERVQERDSEQEGQRRNTTSSSGGHIAGAEYSGHPAQWSVEQVCSYIKSLPGGRVISEEFRSQEIDGQALLLLTEDHLMTAMNIKLGPALKICAHINSLKQP